MIRLCTCTGGSASTLGLIKKRASTASCESCGGKPLVDGTGTPSSSMLSTVGLELTALVNSDLTWNKVSKGNRSSARRARKSLEVGLKTSKELVNKDSKDVNMPVSESEKLGVTVLGCRFSDKAEHVPIKKRRFLFRTPSPPPRTPSPRLEETETIVRRQHALGQGFPQNLTVEFQLATSDGAASADLGQIVDTEVNIHGENSTMVNGQLDENEDFSGISILAAAACSSSLGGYVEEASGVEESLGHKGNPQEPMNIDSKGDLVNSAEMSTEGTASSVSPSPSEESLASLKTDNSSQKDLPLENIKDDTCLQESAVAISKSIYSNKDDAKIRTQESSARDGRLHWDLNTVMDAWEQPFDCQRADFAANVANGIYEYADDVKHSVKNENFEGHEPQREPEGTNDDTGKALLSGESRRLAFETEGLNREEIDACLDIKSVICYQGKILSSEIEHAKDVVMDPLKKTEFSHNQEKIDPNLGSGGSVPAKHASGPSAYDIVDENASANCVNSSTTRNSEILSSDPVASMDVPVDCSLPPESGHFGMRVFEENSNAASINAVSVKNMDDFAGDPQTSGTLSFSPQAENQNDTLPSVASSDKATCDVANALNEDGGDARRSSELLGDGDVENRTCVDIGHGPIDDARESAACESDERDSFQSYHANSVVPPSGAVLGGQPVAPVDLLVQHGEDSFVHGAETDTQVHIDAVETGIMASGSSTALLGPSCGLSSRDACGSYHDVVIQSYGKVALEEPLEDGYDTDISLGDPGIVVGIEKASDYDSQYEDGELRESIVHAWEEYDGEDEETERVDYGSDNRDTNNLCSENTEESNFQARLGGSLRTEVTHAGPSKERVVGTSSPCSRVQKSEKVDSHDEVSGSGPDQATRGEEDNDRQDYVKEANQLADLKMKMSGWDRLPENRRSTSGVTRVRDGSIRKNFSGDQKDGSDAEDTETKVFRSRVNRRELLSQIERPASHRVFLGRDRLGIRGRSYNNDSYPRSEREFDPVRSFGRGRYSLQRGRGGGHWADSSGHERGLKRCRSPTYHGLASFHRSGPEAVASDSSIIKGGGVGSSSQAGRHATNVSSHGLHRSFRSGSPTDRQEAFDTHRSIRAAGEMSPDRFTTVGRGRYVRYGPQVNSGGPRGRYHGPVNDDCIESSLNCSHPLTRRRRSFSPIERRGNPPAHRSNSKSPSRSRTRSPNAWQSPRGRNGAAVAGNLGFRHRSRSPNFRSGARMPRVRSPHLRPGFAPDHEIGFIAARNRDSPPPNSRWIGYKQHSSLLDRRPPGRIHTRGERFDMWDSPRTNEYYRSVHPGRFSELNGVGRGGARHNGADGDRGKHGYRYRLVHPVKRYNLEGAVKRFCYDVEDGFVAAGHESRNKEATDFHGRPKAYSRGVDGRIGDVPRRSREEGGSFLCRQDRKYNANSKSFGMREGDEDEGPRRRPS